MTKFNGYRREVRKFLKLGRMFQELALIDDMDNKTFAALREEMTEIEKRRPVPESRYKEAFPRHGARWDEEEVQALTSQAKSGKVDVRAFAKEYQRRPENVIKYMAKLGFDESHIK